MIDRTAGLDRAHARAREGSTPWPIVRCRPGWDVAAQGLVGSPGVRVLVGAERHDTIDLAPRDLGPGALRVSVSNWSTTTADVEAGLDALGRAAAR